MHEDYWLYEDNSLYSMKVDDKYRTKSNVECEMRPIEQHDNINGQAAVREDKINK